MIHADHAHSEARDFLCNYLRDKTGEWRILLINDLFYRIRVILWCPKRRREDARVDIDDGLKKVASGYWSGDVLKGSSMTEIPDGPWQNDAWEDAEVDPDTTKLRIMERQRTKEGWFHAPDTPPWAAAQDNPAIVAFYSFKGGVGRSTALAATALHLAAAGESVAVLDFDLDAPGVGSLLAGTDGATAAWGIADYLIERPIVGDDGVVDLADYHHRCPTSLFAGSGEIAVFPAGVTNRRYVGKLARLDYGATPPNRPHPFVQLLEEICQGLDPQWILIDSRAGLGNVSGFLMGGLCHVHVLAGTLADASWRGLEMVLDRLGTDRVQADKPQAACVLAAAMVPQVQPRQFRESVTTFTDRARDVFTTHYYSAPREDDYHFWSVDDVESSDAPHVPVVLPYNPSLALFRDLDEVAHDVLLQGEPYRKLVERVRASRQRLARSPL